MVAVCVLVVGAAALGQQSFENVLARIRDHRLSVEIGSVSFETVLERTASSSTHKNLWHVAWSGNKIRSYRKTPDGRWEVVCFGGLPKSTWLFYTDRRPDGDGKTAISLYGPQYVPRSPTFVPYPRWIGSLPLDSLSLIHEIPEDYFSPRNGNEQRCVTEMEDGREVVRLNWKREKGGDLMDCEATVLPSHGYAVENIRCTWTTYGVKYSHQMACKWKQYSNSIGKPWFPESYLFTRTENGSTVERETMSVMTADLNVAIEDDQFTLKRLEHIPASNPVMWVSDEPPPADGELVWTGEAIVGKKTNFEKAQDKF